MRILGIVILFCVAGWAGITQLRLHWLENRVAHIEAAQSITFEGSTSGVATELTFPTSTNRDGTIRTWGSVQELPHELWGGVDGHRFEYIPVEKNKCVLFREDSAERPMVTCPKVKLIQPIKVRTAALVASIDSKGALKGATSGAFVQVLSDPYNGKLSQKIIDSHKPPVASVEEPR